MTDAAPVPRPYAGETPEVRRERRRRRFIDSGKTLFGTLGYRKTTVRGLCAHAGLTDRYFYESFASLEDLLAAAVNDAVRKVELLTTERMAGATQGLGLPPGMKLPF